MANTFLATAAFGLEGVAAGELKRMGLPAKAENGGARFEGTFLDAFRANLHLRTADRVLLVLAEREAVTFEDLFQLVGSVAWERLLTRDAAIHVSGKCVRSRLMSVRDCQAVSKKAIVRRMMERLGVSRLPETGARFPIGVSVVNDRARVTLDMSGEALNRRGYRTWNGEAPLRETAAAALVRLSTWRYQEPLHDPCCGTGTLLIEAAYAAAHRASGLTRAFDMEKWACVDAQALKDIRADARAQADFSHLPPISGSDISPEALELARRHIRQAGLEGKITVYQRDLRDLQLSGPAPCFLCNPPYGERLGDRKACEQLYRAMKGLMQRHPGCTLNVITSHPGFERVAGMHAQGRTRLYNGRLECEFLRFTR